MSADQLQFLFSIFSFIGVIGVIFYTILTKAKQDAQEEQVEFLKEKVIELRDYIIQMQEEDEEEQDASEDSLKEQIINLYEDGKSLSIIEESLGVPRAKLEMVLKFHNIKKSDNWRDSVDRNL